MCVESLVLEVKICLVFFFNDTSTTEIYTLSLHDALPISHTFRDMQIEKMLVIRSPEL